MNFKDFSRVAFMASALTLSPEAAAKSKDANDYVQATVPTVRWRTPDQICREVGDRTHMIMYKKEWALVACQGRKSLFKYAFRATSNPSNTPISTPDRPSYTIDKFVEDKRNHEDQAMPWAMHVDMPHTTLNAIWIHQGRLVERNGDKRISTGCIGIHKTQAPILFNTLKAARNSGKKVTITIKP